MKPKKVTMKMIAEEAGVSIQTVSRVVNQHPDVAQDTSVRIRKVMRRLNYMPNTVARNLSQQRTEMIGVITDTMVDAGPIRILAGVIYGADLEGYCVLMEALKDLSRDEIIRGLTNLASRQVDGILWTISEIGDFHTWLYDYCKEYIDIPMVFMHADDVEDENAVYISNYEAAYRAVNHLIEQGFEHIAHISGPTTWQVADQRKKAWEDALRDARRPVEARALAQGDWSPQSGHNGLRQLMQTYPEMDAIFTANDHTAIGVLQLAQQLGICIPEELGVVGFDDIRMARSFSPSLTTVHQNFREYGVRGVQKLVAMIKGTGIEVDPMIKSRLVVRESSRRKPEGSSSLED